MQVQLAMKDGKSSSDANLKKATHFYQISDKAFELFKSLIHEKAGISLSPAKRTLVVSRLSKRMRTLNLTSFEEYYNLVTQKHNHEELQITIDLLTTNETYFFREDRHFDYLRDEILKNRESGESFRVWSAASSTGEEAYSTAMVIADKFGLYSNWNIFGTDINTDVVKQARRALYPLTESKKIPKDYLRKFCLKGVRSQEGLMLIDSKIKQHVDFDMLNLNADWPSKISSFDVVFLRNVMIYFDLETKQKLVDRIANKIKPGGYLFIGHSESLNQVSDRFKVIRPSICQKIG